MIKISGDQFICAEDESHIVVMPLSIDVIWSCWHPSLFQQQQPKTAPSPAAATQQANKDNGDNLFFFPHLSYYFQRHKRISKYKMDYNKIIFLLVALFSLILVQTFD